MMLEKRNMLAFALFVVYMLLLIGIILLKLPFYSAEISDGTAAAALTRLNINRK